jgi:endonuclease/exonuclease/phosphatase family metal-dependent hydrolase
VAVSSERHDIRILSINVWSGLTYQGTFQMGQYPDNPQRRFALLLAGIRRLDPDIIAIQEANPLPQYAKRLAADLGYQVIYHVSLGGIRFGTFGIPVNLREGEAILTKKTFDVKDLGVRRLGGCGLVTNGFCFQVGEINQALLAEVKLHGNPLYVYAVHLHSGPFQGHALDEAISYLSQRMPANKVEEAKQKVLRDIECRRHEIANLTHFIEDTLPAGAHAIIVGDFNTTVDSGELAPLFRGMWADSYGFLNPDRKGMTWDPQHNPNFREREENLTAYDMICAKHEHFQSRIDFIMVSNNMRTRLLRSDIVLTPSDGFPASDHYGVLTTLRY